MFKVAIALSVTMTQVVGFLTTADYYYRSDRPLLIAHRGTWGEYPEHALAGYVDSYYAGVDFIEFDLQISKD
jgi:glycerophosphoryl diester phosphodiesterase